MFTTLVQARAVSGPLSEPQKMPCMSYGLPAKECKVGSKLRQIPNSTCSTCYALKGRYVFQNVQASQYNRLSTLHNPAWVDAIVFQIQKAPKGRGEYFRWHDSGDIRDIEHLEKIVEVALRLPKVKFWLPTREQGVVRAYQAQYGAFPKNLVVRMSAAMIDGKPPSGFKQTSGVHSARRALGRVCPAPQQDNKCGNCRACWDPKVKHVSYHKH